MRQDDADRHRLAVDQPLWVVAAGRLKRVREGVAEIEQRPLASFQLVRGDGARLEAHCLGNRAHACRATGKHLRAVCFQPLEELLVADQPGLCHLGIAGAELALGKRVERGGVG